ncbi:hypothetical protein ACJ2A9_01580 [Anaerobacillus sp. MEB173]|uniref:hypothetical protein n=1 Tax=Anaerobacillus sp. MEB173 TaxID=3383345 RepID=UPI003F91DB60
MSEANGHKELPLRIATPTLYNKLVETLEPYHIHPFDIQGTVMRKEDGLDVTLRYSQSFSQSETAHFNNDQVEHPDEDVTEFFKATAERCKTQLIKDYYKMMKP